MKRIVVLIVFFLCAIVISSCASSEIDSHPINSEPTNTSSGSLEDVDNLDSDVIESNEPEPIVLDKPEAQYICDDGFIGDVCFEGITYIEDYKEDSLIIYFAENIVYYTNQMYNEVLTQYDRKVIVSDRLLEEYVYFIVEIDGSILSLQEFCEQYPSDFLELVESKKFTMIRSYTIPDIYETGQTWCDIDMFNDFCVTVE